MTEGVALKDVCFLCQVNVNFVHQEGTGRRLKLKTALILAVRRGLYDTVEGILSVNADPNIQDQKGRSYVDRIYIKLYTVSVCNEGAIKNGYRGRLCGWNKLDVIQIL